MIQRIVEEYRDGCGLVDGNRGGSDQVEGRLGVTGVTRGEGEGGVAAMSEVVADPKPTGRP